MMRMLKHFGSMRNGSLTDEEEYKDVAKSAQTCALGKLRSILYCSPCRARLLDQTTWTAIQGTTLHTAHMGHMDHMVPRAILVTPQCRHLANRFPAIPPPP